MIIDVKHNLNSQQENKFEEAPDTPGNLVFLNDVCNYSAALMKSYWFPLVMRDDNSALNKWQNFRFVSLFLVCVVVFGGCCCFVPPS